jgi:hypothetical protein
MDALAAGHDVAVQMIDTSIVRVHHALRYDDGVCSSVNIGAWLGCTVRRPTGKTGRLLAIASV